MAVAPMPTSDPGTDPNADPNAAAPPDDTSDESDVILTVTRDPNGGYLVYAGDEPENGEPGDMSEDDANAMGPDGGGPAPQHADSVGEAAKLIVDILRQADSGGPGAAEGAFQSGFGSPAPQATPITTRPGMGRPAMMA